MKRLLRSSKPRLIPLARHHSFRTPTAAGPAAVDELTHRRNGDRSEGRARDIDDFIENFAKGLALRRCIGSPGVLLNGVQVFEQLDHVQQRCTPSIAGELITATRATNRADPAGTAHDMHDFRQVVAGDAVLLAKFGDGKPTAFARGEFQNREDGKPGRNLQPHDIAIRMSLSGKILIAALPVQSRSFSSWM